jgi:tetratricopeptide (TPR) repeat protein
MKKQYIYIIIALILVVLIGTYFSNRTHLQENLPIGSTVSPSATTTLSTGVNSVNNSIIKEMTVKTKDDKGVITSKTMSYDEYLKWARSNLKVPVFETISKIPTTYPESAQKLIVSKFNTAIADLKTDPYSFDKWLNLGSVRQMAEDYVGAEEVYLFANELSPNNSVAFHNLGYLYGYYLHDNVKAEMNYLKAIENKPQQLFLYYQTAEFYKNVIKDLSKARAIVEKGIKVNPNATTDLNTLLWSLQDPIKK